MWLFSLEIYLDFKPYEWDDDPINLLAKGLKPPMSYSLPSGL
jgi:hypothetical protein